MRASLEGGPFIVKVCTRPTSWPNAFERRIAPGLRRPPAVLLCPQERAPARALAAVQGGGEISTGLFRGTLGGFLQEASMEPSTGVTCAHVAMASTGTFDLLDVGGANLTGAAVIAQTTFPSLTMLNSGQLCNRAVTNGRNPDVALLELTLGHTGRSSVRSIGIIDDILTENDLGLRVSY